LARRIEADTIPARLAVGKTPRRRRCFVMEDSPTGQLHPVPRIVVCGVDGVVGGNLALGLGERAAVHGLFFHHPVSLEGCTTAACRPHDAGDLRRQVEAASPHWIVHCGPLGRGSWDIPPEEPQAEREAGLSVTLAEIAGRVGGRLTVISTDAVFAGPRMFHEEKSSAASSEPFALAARRVEQVLADRPRVLVVRTHAYGWSPRPAEPSFAERVWQHLAEGTPCRLDAHNHATPILASDLAELLWLAYRRGLEGLYHVAGAERTSAYRFAVDLAACFGLQSSPAATAEEGAGAPGEGLLRETSLSTGRARRELERPMPMLREGLDRFARQAESGFRARLRGSAPQTAWVRSDAA